MVTVHSNAVDMPLYILAFPQKVNNPFSTEIYGMSLVCVGFVDQHNNTSLSERIIQNPQDFYIIYHETPARKQAPASIYPTFMCQRLLWNQK